VSDFLKQFEESNYRPDDRPAEQDGSVLTRDNQPSAKIPRQRPDDERNHGDSRLQDSLPDDRAEANTKQKIKGAAHEIKADDKHHKRKLVRYAIVAVSILAFCLLAFGIFFLANRVVVQDFVGISVTEARTWGISNRITIETTEEFTLEAESGIVMSQDRAPDSSMQRGGVLRLVVSQGPDPDERIELPDFNEMTTAEVRQWRQDVAALNANINEEYSDDVEQHHFIRAEFTDSTVTTQTYTRADGLLIYMSRGAETLEANIVVPNFMGQSKQEVEMWAEENSVDVVFAEAASDDIPEGHVVKQSIEPRERIARDADLIITLSLGRFVTVPNFHNLSQEEAGMVPGLELIIRQRFSTTVAFGRLISQSVSAGTEVQADTTQVTVTYSLGRPYLEDLRGQSESVLAEYFFSFTSQGANITYTVVYVDSHEPRGSIVAMSKYAQFLGLQDHITISVSRGNLTPPPGFEDE